MFTESEVNAILEADKNSFGQHLENFVEKADKVFAFPELHQGTKRKQLWKTLCEVAQTTEDHKVLKNCFIAIRILSREKENLNELITEEWIELLKKHIGLKEKNFKFNSEITSLCLEAEKSLCNIVYNCRVVAAKCCENGILEGIVRRISQFEKKDIPEDIKYFDMKLLFLLSALCPSSRNKLRVESLPTLANILDLELQQAIENHTRNDKLPPVFLTDKQADLVCELLKALFNVTAHIDVDRPDTDAAEIMAIMINMTESLRNYLSVCTDSFDKTWMLRSNVVNLLNNVPGECYKYLLTPIQDSHTVPKNLQFEDYNMTAIYEILMLLRAKFNDEAAIAQISNQNEVLSPVVTVLLKGAASDRAIRKFLRHQILPPLTDVHTRPEQGTTLRNHLCRLLTTPITQLRDLVADLLFVLCKKNVTRMIKYTGYGNAAGLFAQRGLLAGGRDKGESEYSSDGEDSETEEYADYKHGINPVLGCYEEPHPNAMDNMTEEQKEHEAMKLVELMDNLMKAGTIKPCRVGEDGRPVPIEHVLELQEGLRAQQVRNTDDSD